MPSNKKIAYLFNTFPVRSETFLQREIKSLLENSDLDIELYSLLGGGKSFLQKKIYKFNKLSLILLPIKLITIGLQQPKLIFHALKSILENRPKSLLNISENLIGFCFGILYGKQLKNNNVTHIHAAWATMPATAALVINKIYNIPFSMGGHAYDIFEHNGDQFIKNKIKQACFIHADTQNAKNQLIKLGAQENQVKRIYRGVDPFPDLIHKKHNNNDFHIISIGRLVEKKGFDQQLEIYNYLKEKQFPFQARIIGDGPLRSKLEKKINHYNLNKEVKILGWLQYPQVEQQHAWAHAFLFTGIIDKKGNRDGLPNVILEAMALGTPVISTNVSAVPEAIIHQETGFIIQDISNKASWYSVFCTLKNDKELYNSIVLKGRNWAETYFDPKKNIKSLMDCFYT